MPQGHCYCDKIVLRHPLATFFNLKNPESYYILTISLNDKLLFLCTGLVYGLSSLIINGTSVKVGYLWDNPRHENVDTSEVVMDSKYSSSILRLICDILPPLPNDEEHWEKKNELVKWYKTGPKTEEVKRMRYWSSEMTKTAISFSNVTLDTLGTYSCSYGDISATIDVLGKKSVFTV